MSNDSVFGEAKFGGTKTNWFNFPKEGGTLTLRILPPVGSLKKSGKWSQYYSIHFGYRDSKGKLRPFQSCEVKDRQTKMIEVMDPAQERINKLKAAQDKAKVENNLDLVKKIGEQLRIFNRKNSYYVNAMDLNGKIGVFGMPYKMKAELDAEIAKLQAKGINPLSVDNGRYFAFTRTGTGGQTSHKVQVYKEQTTISGVQAEIDKVSVLTPDVGSRVLTEGADLGSIYIAPTPEEISAIMNGDGSVLEAIFKKYRGQANDLDSVEAEEDSDSQPAQQTPPPQAPAVKQQSTAAMQVNTPVSEPSSIEEPVIVESTAADITKMSNEDFLKLMGM